MVVQVTTFAKGFPRIFYKQLQSNILAFTAFILSVFRTLYNMFWLVWTYSANTNKILGRLSAKLRLFCKKLFYLKYLYRSRLYNRTRINSV